MHQAPTTTVRVPQEKEHPSPTKEYGARWTWDPVYRDYVRWSEGLLIEIRFLSQRSENQRLTLMARRCEIILYRLPEAWRQSAVSGGGRHQESFPQRSQSAQSRLTGTSH
jgi:hypothetical protein